MEQKTNDHKSIWMLVSSMLIFGTIGVFRRFIPQPGMGEGNGEPCG